eukprot:TRINITY_DN252_c0_g2_i8.p1 TRINITY_DN252_c0_g2~~TRINITY_DN252_c0_g2_i8.p1  ORF type:complete len:622 (-),score=109.48 TRINITY_DN252_c0_g2_i8:88-1953(-)
MVISLHSPAGRFAWKPGANCPTMQAIMRAEEEQIQRLFHNHQGALQDLFMRLCDDRKAWLEEALDAETKHSSELTREGVSKLTSPGGSDVGLVAKSASTVTGEGEGISRISHQNQCQTFADATRRDTNDIIFPTNSASPVTEEQDKSCQKTGRRRCSEHSSSIILDEAQQAHLHMMKNIRRSRGGFISRQLSDSLGLETKTRRWSGYPPLRAFTDHSAFMVTVAAVVIACIYVVAADVHRSVVHIFEEKESVDTDIYERAMELCVSIFFLVELVLRMVAEGSEFFTGEEKSWNIFDSVLVALSVVWIALDVLSSTGKISYVQTFRLVRLLRTLRVLRLTQTFRMLRLMTLSVLKAFWIVGSAFVLLFLFITTVSILLMQGIIVLTDSGQNHEKLEELEHFKGFGNTCLCLFMAVTGGMDYWELAKPLFNLNSGLGIGFMAYVALMSVGILNIITGIFVQVAAELAAQDRVILTQSQMSQDATLMRSLMKLFPELDKDGSELITLEEFEACASDPHNAAYFTALGLDITKSKRFFNLIDQDGSGQLTVEEFVMGCMRLKGHSKVIDFETLASENLKLRQRMKAVETNLIGALVNTETKLVEAIGEKRAGLTGDLSRATIRLI